MIAQLVLLILFLRTLPSTTIFRAFRPCDQLDENYHGSNSYMHDDYVSLARALASHFGICSTHGSRVSRWHSSVSFCLMWRHGSNSTKLDSDFLQKDRKFEEVGESDSAFRRARVEQKTALRTEAIQPKGDEIFSFAQLFHFMYDNYEPQYWWFECFDYVRRLALTGLMVIVLPGSALQGFIGVLIALGGLLSYNTFNPFVEDASDRLAMAAQLATFFVFLSALMIQVDVVYHHKGFGALPRSSRLPPVVALCSALPRPRHDERSGARLESAEGSSPPTKSARSSEATAQGPDRVEDDEEQQKPVQSETHDEALKAAL